jgi:hypothetical protein
MRIYFAIVAAAIGTVLADVPPAQRKSTLTPRGLRERRTRRSRRVNIRHNTCNPQWSTKFILSLRISWFLPEQPDSDGKISQRTWMKRWRKQDIEYRYDRFKSPR